MAIRLYAEALRRNPESLLELDKKFPGLLKYCPECGSPMLVFSQRWRQGLTEYLCSNHGLVVLPMEIL